MSIKFNEVTWYSKLGAVILFLLVVPVLTFYIGREYQKTVELTGATNVSAPVVEKKAASEQRRYTDPLRATYTIDGVQVSLVDGMSEQAIPGSTEQIVTRIFGQPVTGDLSGDGSSDIIFFVSQETGGTGTFFYAVAAVFNNGSYVGTNAVFLGDRIAPQNINITNGIAAVNYAVRKDSDPMTESPSVGVTKYLKIKNGELVENVSAK